MDWRSIGFDWNRARAFLVTAEEGSYSAAAKALQMTQSTLGRQVAALEEELGIVLFERVGKGIEMTPAGFELVEFVRQMGQAASGFSLAATGRSSHIEGSVAITASEAIAGFLLPSITRRIREKEPLIQIEIVATNSSSDLKRREADVAVRNFKQTNPDFIAKKIKNFGAYLYATPDYLSRLGNHKKVSELSQAEFIGIADNSRYIEGLKGLGIELSDANFPYSSDSHFVHWSLVRAGAGIGVMVEPVGDTDPDVKKVLENLPPLPVETWVVAHRELKSNRRIRFVFDVLVAELSNLQSSLSHDS